MTIKEFKMEDLDISDVMTAYINAKRQNEELKKLIVEMMTALGNRARDVTDGPIYNYVLEDAAFVKRGKEFGVW